MNVNSPTAIRRNIVTNERVPASWSGVAGVCNRNADLVKPRFAKEAQGVEVDIKLDRSGDILIVPRSSRIRSFLGSVDTERNQSKQHRKDIGLHGKKHSRLGLSWSPTMYLTSRF